jgi:hypothetical protein
MKKIILTIAFLLFSIPMVISHPADTGYIIIGWNDLGMHCCNTDFSTLCILPPYNNVRAQVIIKGNESNLPQVATTDLKVTYEIPGNTYSVGKTNFWDYANAIFGTTLAPNIGLTGAGLTGSMKIADNHFYIDGIPITPYTDADLQNIDPYQQGLLKLYDLNNNLLATANPVIPVSNEISCIGNGCHSSEASIINNHEQEGGFEPNNKPIFCAKCHADNALGTTGSGEAGIFSYRIHNKHASITNDCYKCHPGPKTKCLRDTMFTKGIVCTNCHGSVANVASTIRNNGRRPWLDEPTCSQTGCHKPEFSTQTNTLFKNSKGHAGIYCSACHGSPHALYPTIQPRDNAQMVALQGNPRKLSDCKVCHGYTPNAPGPHGIVPTKVEEISKNYPSNTGLMQNYPNPVSGATSIPFKVSKAGYVRIDVFNPNGNKAASLVNEYLAPGEYSARFEPSFLSNGAYVYTLNISNQTIESKKLIIKR